MPQIICFPTQVFGIRSFGETTSSAYSMSHIRIQVQCQIRGSRTDDRTVTCDRESLKHARAGNTTNENENRYCWIVGHPTSPVAATGLRANRQLSPVVLIVKHLL